MEIEENTPNEEIKVKEVQAEESKIISIVNKTIAPMIEKLKNSWKNNNSNTERVSLTQNITTNSARLEFVGNTKYLVVDAVLVREMVLNGIMSPLSTLTLLDNGNEFISDIWNGTAITLPTHPDIRQNKTQEGNEIWVFGEVRNSITDMKNRSINAELWLNFDKLTNRGFTDFIENTLKGDKIENSIAYWATLTEAKGEFNGIQYDRIITNTVTPNHHAILLNEVGACSVDSGCGLNQNSSEGVEIMKTKEEVTEDKVVEDGKEKEVSKVEKVENKTEAMEATKPAKKIEVVKAINTDNQLLAAIQNLSAQVTSSLDVQNKQNDKITNLTNRVSELQNNLSVGALHTNITKYDIRSKMITNIQSNNDTLTIETLNKMSDDELEKFQSMFCKTEQLTDFSGLLQQSYQAQPENEWVESNGVK